MSAIRRFEAALCVAVVAITGQALAGRIALSGMVVTPDATPLANVTVRLAQAGLTATTDAQGAWTLTSGTTAIRGVHSAPITKAGNLRVENGHLQVRLDGRDIAGRGQGSSLTMAGAQAVMMARSQVTVPDTLVYTYNQKVFLRDTISALDQSGIVRMYDTTVKVTITYGYLKDVRDGKRYRTVTIGTQTWMAENLNFRTDSSYCYQSDTGNCAKYGRLYEWAAAMGLNDSCNTKLCASQVAPKMQGACPSGWHVPRDAEWTKLTDTTLVAATTGTKLKANSSLWHQNTGTDDYGFTVLPAGYLSNGLYYYLGVYAYYWSASESDGRNAWERLFSLGKAKVDHNYDRKTIAVSLRCLQD
jgi:uncharacterized protein (TIGR02145 family)